MSNERITFRDELVFRDAAALLFGRERARIATLLPDAVIEHIGSTAIPGSLTKGDLDILVRVPPARFVEAEIALATVYARNEGSDRSDSFAAFRDDAATPPLGVQLCAADGPEDNFVRLRDLLLAHPDLRAEYNALKNAHAEGSMTAYRAAKSAWIERTLSSHRSG